MNILQTRYMIKVFFEDCLLITDPDVSLIAAGMTPNTDPIYPIAVTSLGD